MDKLTPKQELFVQGIISGLSQRQAYRQAYKADKMSDEAVDVKASRIFKEAKVRLRYRELLKQFSNMSLWSREQAFNEYEWLKNKARSSIENDGVRQANSNAFLSALDGMNNMAWKDFELTDEKIRQEIELLKLKIEKNQDSKSDTTLMEALLNAVKGGDEVED
ncbi:TPA: terminase [Streptococcus pneumoniae]|nr:MAG TPA: Terminase small subunit [Caudoviricetes sp.]HEV9398052.1 terminase [Streptococcus pneumoniae]